MNFSRYLEIFEFQNQWKMFHFPGLWNFFEFQNLYKSNPIPITKISLKRYPFQYSFTRLFSTKGYQQKVFCIDNLSFLLFIFVYGVYGGI